MVTKSKDRGPLSGIRVLEFGQIAAGPFAGSLLADLGADVVKVERPDGGDGMRSWPPLSRSSDERSFSENFASLNRNKRSMTIDFKDENQIAHVHKLVSVADVVIENFRPGVLKRFGLGYETLTGINSRLVYCSITGYGQTGPYASKGAFDVTVQGVSGLMSVTGEEGGEPVKCGVPVGDFCAGLYAAYCIVASVNRAQVSGQGAYIDCSMVGSLIGVAALQTSEYFGTGNAPRALGSTHPRNAPYQAFHAKDDYLVVAAGNDRLWCEVCEALSVQELADEPRFATQELRARNQKELVALLEPRFSQRTVSEWLDELDKRGVPCAPINTYPDILNDPHVRHMRLVRPVRLPNGVQTSTTAFPICMSNLDFEVYREPPELGAHTAEILSEWLGRGCDRSVTEASPEGA